MGPNRGSGAGGPARAGDPTPGPATRTGDMTGSMGGRRWPDVNEFVEAYESAQARDGRADLSDFMPPTEHPARPSILCELVRVDLEYHWERGQPRRLEHFRDRFPDLFAAPDLVRAMAFEEYRLRLQAGESAT